MEGDNTIDWCSVDANCKNLPNVPNEFNPHELPIIDGNASASNVSSSNDSCSYPFCVVALYYTIENTNVRIYDLVLLAMSAIFLFYLIFFFVPTMRKLHESLPLFKILYAMVFVIPVLSCIHEAISMSLGYYSTSAKVFHVILRGDILMTELSVVIFGLFFKYYGNHYCKLMLTLTVIIGISVVFTVLEGLMELLYKSKIACSSFEFFTHGGMIFLFATSTLFAAVYLTIFMLYLFNFHHKWGLPTKKSFYRYALFLSLVNMVQAIGSMLWYTAKSQHPHRGNAGICLTTFTTVIYVGTFAPVVYWIFLKNYFRMNKYVKGPGRINTSAQDSSLAKRPFVVTPRPIQAKKRGFFEDQTSLIAGSYSSTSSYGSLNDEEIFTRHPES